MIRKLSFFLCLIFPLAASANVYEIDPDHTEVGFAIRHLMVSNVKGSFTDVKGTLTYDPKNVAASKLDVTVGATSIDTRNKKRDDHLRSPDFFDTAKFPAMSFASKKVEDVGDGKLKVTGDLTIRGVSKEIVLDVTGPSSEVVDPWGNTKMGASASAKLNRKDFGLTWNKALEAGGVVVGDDVTVNIEVELMKKKG